MIIIIIIILMRMLKIVQVEFEYLINKFSNIFGSTKKTSSIILINANKIFMKFIFFFLS